MNIIEITGNIKQWFDLVKQKMLSNSKDRVKDNVWLIANESQINGILGFFNCLRLESGAENFKCIFNCSDDRLDIDWNVKPFSDILANYLPINVIKDGKLGTYRHLSLNKDFDSKLSTNYYFNGFDITNIKWFDLTHFRPAVEHPSANIKLVKCEIYYSALNFRDVVIATGK